jgi:glutamyl-tRNA synthetase
VKSAARVRFAPSPTGFLHLGGIRSALFNWLYARKTAGTFVLRLEDTDRERFVPEAEAHLVESLKWLGIGPDEGVGAKDTGPHGPYVQSERLDLYQKRASELVENGSLYPCWCSSERLARLREEAQSNKQAFKYDRHCLSNPGDPEQPHVLRFKMPDNQPVTWDDAVRGKLVFQTNDLDDFVAVKSDKFPTYQFANVVDDHEMAISHVLRADEWIPSTPKHILLYEAFGWSPPVFAHLPAVVPPGGGKKLSKRHGAKTALELRDMGYLPDAVINFMAGLGWNAGEGSTKEIYTREELIEAFTLERIQKSPAVFDEERLNWLNGVYIRSLPLNELAKYAESFWPAAAKKADVQYKEQVLGLVQERLKYLSELPELTDFFFESPQQIDFSQAKKISPSDAQKWVSQAAQRLEEIEFTHDTLEATLRALADDLQVKTGDLFMTLRIATTGKTASPGLFETMTTLGKAEVLARLGRA